MDITNNMIEQVVVGSILGDAHISKGGHYCESHCKKQEDYLLWKNKILKKKFSTKINYYKKGIPSLYTRVHPDLKEYRQLVYPDGKKRITKEIIDKIGNLAIVVWYFDDGSYQPLYNGIEISSYCFSYEENKMLQKMLKDKFSLNFNIYHRHAKNHYYLGCAGENTDIFLSFIKRNALYIPKNLTYKLGNFDKRNIEWIKDKRQQKRDMDKEHYKKNSKRIKKQTNRYYWKNRKRMRKIADEYYQKNKEKWIVYGEKYRENNWVKVLESNKRWRKKNPNYYKEYYWKNHAEQRRKRNIYQRLYRKRLKKQ